MWKKHKGFIIQLIFLALCLVFIIKFLTKEKAEVKKALHILSHADMRWLVFGIGLCLLLVLWQGIMYVLSFRTINTSIKLTDGILLYLKRNTAGVFLPAGGVTSLVLFTKHLEEKGISKEQNYAATSIYGFCGILTVGLVAIPILAYLSLHSAVLKSEVAALVGVIVILAAIAGVVISALKRGFIYKLLIKRIPRLVESIERVRHFKFNKKYFFLVVLFSLAIELTGVGFLYAAMYAAGVKASLSTALIGYAISILIFTISPFMDGTGAIEIVLTYILKSSGYNISEAVSITLIFRFFQFWFIILLGIVPLLTELKWLKKT